MRITSRRGHIHQGAQIEVAPHDCRLLCAFGAQRTFERAKSTVRLNSVKARTDVVGCSESFARTMLCRTARLMVELPHDPAGGETVTSGSRSGRPQATSAGIRASSTRPLSSAKMSLSRRVSQTHSSDLHPLSLPWAPWRAVIPLEAVHGRSLCQ